MKNASENLWTEQQVSEFVNDAIRQIGGKHAWALLVPQLQDAVLARTAFHACATCAKYHRLTKEDMSGLLQAMRRKVGLSRFNV